MADPFTLYAFFTGLGWGAATAAVAAVVTAVVINLAIAAVLGKILAPAFEKQARAGKGVQLNTKTNIAPRKTIYGEAVVGGPFLFMESYGETETDGVTIPNARLNFIIGLAGHPVEDIIGVFMGDEYITIEDGRSQVDIAGEYDVIGGAYTSIVIPIFGIALPLKFVKICKVKGWAYADKQYVNDETDPTVAAEIAADQARAEWIADEIQADWNVSGLTRNSTTGLWEAAGGADREKLTNCAYIFMQLNWNRDRLPNLPQIRFHVKGKRVYNPDKDSSTIMQSYGATGGTHDLNDVDTYEWSDDWSLCCLDYLMDTNYGLAAIKDPTDPMCEIDWEAAIQSYKDSSEVITNGYLNTPYIGTGPRYTINGAFEVDSTPISLMEALLTSGAGELIYAQGKYKLRPGIYRPPASENDIINEDMIVSPLTITTHASRSQIFNKVAGIYMDKGYTGQATATNSPTFEPADFPLVNPVDTSGNNPYEIEDGSEIVREFDFPFTTSSHEAQRIARIQLERVRRGFAVQFEGTLELLKYSVGDTVYLEILSNSKYINEDFYNHLGLDSTVQDDPVTPKDPYYKQFKIMDMAYTNRYTISVTMIEEAEEIYDWNDGYAVEPTDALVSDIPADDFRGDAIPPSWIVSTGLDTITEVAAGTDIITELRWSASDRGTSLNGLDAAYVSAYEIQYGAVTDTNATVSEDRVGEWLRVGIFAPVEYLLDQGPAVINNLYIDSNTDFDFRIRSILITGKRSEWVYYNEEIGSDFSPTAPYGNFFIVAPNGNSIQNGIGTLDVEVRQRTSAGIVSVGTPSTIQLYLANTPFTNYGYSASFGATDIDGKLSLVLSDGDPSSGGTIIDSITLLDVYDGAEGTQGRTVSLTADKLAFVYDSSGLNPETPSSADFTATGFNFDTAEEYQFLVDGSTTPSGQSWSTTNTFTYNAPADYNDLPVVITVEARNNGETVAQASDSVTVVGLKPGTDGAGQNAYTVILSNEAHTLATDNGGVVDYTASGATIDVFDGTTRLTGVSGTPGANQYNVSVSSITPTSSITVGTITHGQPTTVANHSSMSQDTVVITYAINIEDTVTIYKDQSLSKSFEGADGADGLNNATVYLYQRTATETPVPDAPTQNVTYTFASGAVDIDTADNAWSATLPASGGDYLWVTQAVASGIGVDDTIAPAEWLDPPELLSINGVDGINSRTVSLTAGQNAFEYLSDNSLNDNANTTITATALNTEGTPYYQFLVNGGSVQNSTTNTYTYTPDSTWDGQPDTIEVRLREGGTGGTVYASDQISIVQIKPGVDAPQITQSNEAHAVPVDSPYAEGDHDYTGSGNTINVYLGNTSLSYDDTTPFTAPSFRVSAVGTNITVGTQTNNSFGTVSNMTADTAYITYTITVVNAEGIENTFTRVQSFSRSKQGIQGNAGNDGYTVSVTANDLAFEYDSAGATPSPANTTVTATGYNFTSPQYQFSINGTPDQTWSATNTYTYTPDPAYSNMPEVVTVEAREGASGVADATDSIAMFGLKTGTDAITVVSTNDSHSFVAANDGTVSDYTGSGISFTVYEGGNQLTPDTTTPFGDSTFRVDITTETNVTMGTVSINGNAIDVANATSVDQTPLTASVLYTITVIRADGSQEVFTRTQSFTKSIKGDTGADPVTINYSNTAHSVPVTIGGSETWTGSGGLLRVLEGNTFLTLRTDTQTSGHTSLSNGEFQVDITAVSGDTLGEPSITGATTTFCSLGEWSGDLTGVTVYRLNVYIQDSLGVQHTLITDITLTPSLEGDTGASVDVIFKRSQEQPSTPSPSAGVPATWYADIDSVPAGTNPIWASFGEKAVGGSTYTWQTPVRLESSNTLYVKGTGANNNSNRVVRVSGADRVNGSGRGFTLSVMKRSDLSEISYRRDGTGTGTLAADQNYDTYAVEADRLALRDALVELRTNGNTTLSAGNWGEDIFIIITSYDANNLDTTNGALLITEMLNHGAKNSTLVRFNASTYRIPYLLIGIPGIGEYNGIEIMTNDGASTPPAEYFGTVQDGTLPGLGASLGLDSTLGWSHTLVFSVTSPTDTTVAWSSGTVKLPDGKSYTITAGDTGSMSARTYIYLDTAVSTTTLQTTTTATNAVGRTQLLIAVAEDSTDTDSDAFFQVFGGAGGLKIGANEIAADSITANNIKSGNFFGVTFTGSTFQSRTADSATGPNSVRSFMGASGFELHVSGATTPFSDSEVFSVGLDGNNQPALNIDGNILSNKVDQNIFSTAGLESLRGALGVTAPSGQATGGNIINDLVPISLATTTTPVGNTINIDNSSPWQYYVTANNEQTVSFTIRDSDWDSFWTKLPFSSGFTKPVWDCEVEYGYDSVGDVSTAPSSGWLAIPGGVGDFPTIEGTTEIFSEPMGDGWYLVDTSFQLNVTKTFNWTPTAPTAETDYIYYRLRITRVSGSTNTPRITAFTASEQIVSPADTFEGLNDTNITSVDTGDTLYWNGTDWVNLGAGTSGQVLTANGVSSAPSWQTPGSGIGGSISTDQVAFGSGTNTISGSANFTFDDTYLAVGGSSTGARLRGHIGTTTPTLIPRGDDLDTGFGQAGANEANIVAGGVEMMRWINDGTATTRYNVCYYPIYINEQSTANNDFAAYGQFWVRDDNPNTPWYTDGDGGDLPLGFNAAPPVSVSASQNFLRAEVGRMLHVTTSGITLTCATDANTWNGATWIVHNDSTGDITINVSGTTLYWIEAGSAPASGNVTVSQGGIVTIYKRTTTEFWAWGAKSAATGGGVSILNDLNDVVITAAASGEYIRHNGTSWVDAALDISDDTSPTLGGELNVSTFDINGSSGVTLQYNGLDNIVGTTVGADIQSTSATSVYLNLKNSSGTTQTFLGWNPSAGNVRWKSNVNGTPMEIVGNNASGTERDILISDPDSLTSLYAATDLYLRCNISNIALWADAASSVYLYHNNGQEFRTVQHEGNGSTSGAETYDHAGNLWRNVGFNDLRVYENPTSGGLTEIYLGALIYCDLARSYSAPSATTNFPVGGVVQFANYSTTNSITITSTASYEIHLLTGTTVTDTGTSLTIGPGGMATLIRVDSAASTVDPNYIIFGSGITA